MTTVQMFKAAKKTNRWNLGQRVWVRYLCANHIYVWFKFRGSGRYVEGIVDRHEPSVGEIVSIEVDDEFAVRVHSGA